MDSLNFLFSNSTLDYLNSLLFSSTSSPSPSPQDTSSTIGDSSSTGGSTSDHPFNLNLDALTSSINQAFQQSTNSYNAFGETLGEIGFRIFSILSIAYFTWYIVFYLISWPIEYFYDKTRAENMMKIAKAKREERDSKTFSKDYSSLLVSTPQMEQDIFFEKKAWEIANLIRLRHVTSKSILQGICRRAHIVGLKELNAVTEELYESGLKQAEIYDEAVSKLEMINFDDILGGVPISIKDSIGIKNTDSTCGMVARCNKPANQDALVVSLLKDVGAIPYVKTNIPQSLLTIESNNNIYGATCNPYDLKRTSGGSSGGEAALIASRSSFLGIGTDIGGSIRGPCAWTGLYGFKPTPQRVSKVGSYNARKGNKNGQLLIPSTAGPMGLCVKDLALVCQAWWVERHFKVDPYVTPKLFDKETWEYGILIKEEEISKNKDNNNDTNNQTHKKTNSSQISSPPTSPSSSTGASNPFKKRSTYHKHENSKEKIRLNFPSTFSTTKKNDDSGIRSPPHRPDYVKKKLKVGYIKTDNFFQPCLSVLRAIDESIETLEEQGIECVPVDSIPCNGWEVIQVYFSLMAADGSFHYMMEGLDGETLIDSYEMSKKYSSMPNWLRNLMGEFLGMSGEYRTRCMLKCTEAQGLNTRAYWQRAILLKEMQAKYVHMMQKNQFDAILLPAFPLPAPHHGDGGKLLAACTYMFLPNLLYWPAGVVPVTKVREGEDNYYPNNSSENKSGKSYQDNVVKSMKGGKDVAEVNTSSLPPNQRDSIAQLSQKVMQNSVGLPVGVQIMTMSNMDELCLHVMNVLEEGLKQKRKEAKKENNNEDCKESEDPSFPVLKTTV